MVSVASPCHSESDRAAPSLGFQLPISKMLSSRALFCVALAVIACASVGERSLYDVVVLHLAAAAGSVPGVYGAGAQSEPLPTVGPTEDFAQEDILAMAGTAVRARMAGCHSQRRRASGRRGERGFLRQKHFAEDRQCGTHI